MDLNFFQDVEYPYTECSNSFIHSRTYRSPSHVWAGVPDIPLALIENDIIRPSFASKKAA
jgi:hypothetical protein